MLENVDGFLKASISPEIYFLYRKAIDNTIYAFHEFYNLSSRLGITTKPSDISFSHVIIGLCVTIIFYVAFEKYVAKALYLDRLCFIRNRWIFSGVYLCNWLFILSLFTSSFTSTNNWKEAISYHDLVFLIKYLGIALLFTYLLFILLAILPSLFKYIVSILPATCGIHLVSQEQNQNNIILLILLIAISLALLYLLNEFFADLSMNMQMAIGVIIRNLPAIFTFGILSFSILFFQVFVLRFLMSNSEFTSLYFLYLLFNLFWCNYVALYSVATFALSLIVDTKTKKMNGFFVQTTTALCFTFNSFGSICFFALMPSFFDILITLLECIQGSLNNLKDNFVFFISKQAMSLSIMTVRFISSYIFNYNYYSLLEIKLLGQQSAYKSQTGSIGTSNGISICGIRLIRSVKNSIPVLFLLKCFFFKTDIFFSAEVVDYAIFISYYLLEALLCVIGPTFNLISFQKRHDQKYY